MKLKIFGYELYKYQKPLTEEELKIYDFAQWGVVNDTQNNYSIDSLLQAVTPVEIKPKNGRGRPKKEKPPVEKPKEVTPKELFEAKALNDNKFSFNVDPDYLDKQIEDCSSKLQLMYPDKARKKRDPFDMDSDDLFAHGGIRYGRQELKSIIERLNNRKRIKEVKDVVDKYPHTTTALIQKVLSEHKDILRFGKADTFVPDFPMEAAKAMNEYDKMCQKLCKKDTWFYVLANKKDFEKVQRRRDPILFAQSPFGFFWNILGAWEEEMQYLGDL